MTHYLDDILMVMGDNRSCMCLVSAAMHAKGYRVCDKSVLEPTTWVKWLGTKVDLEALTISNNVSIVTRLFACFVILWGRYVSAKDLMQVVGLIGWLGTPATGNLPFLGGGGVKTPSIAAGRTG